MYTSKEMGRMAISQVFSALLDYLNASLAGVQSCINISESTDIMDFIESVCP